MAGAIHQHQHLCPGIPDRCQVIVCREAVIANGIHDAIGVRLRQLPMTPERIKKALGRKS